MGTVLTSQMRFRVRGPLSLLEPLLSRLLAKDSSRDEQRRRVCWNNATFRHERKHGWATGALSCR